MKALRILAPLALLAVPFVAQSASADEITIKTRSDRGMHRGFDHAPAFGARRTVVKKTIRRGDIDSTGSVKVTKKVTRTNAFGDRVTKKVTHESD